MCFSVSVWIVGVFVACSITSKTCTYNCLGILLTRKSHLAPYLPSHPLAKNVGGEKAFGVVSSAPWGSALILPISYAYIRMMGPQGLRKATQVSYA